MMPRVCFFTMTLIHICVLGVLWGHSATVQAMEVTGSNITGGQWIDADARVEVHLDQAPREGELRVFVGQTDATLLFQVSGNNLVFQPGIMELPKGESKINIYHVYDHTWDVIGSVAIRVREVSGFDRFEVTPQLNMTVKSQLKEGHSVDAGAPPRSTFNDLTGQGGVNVDIARADFSAQAQASLVGSSYREEALRFSQKDVHAPKVDLSDYLVSLHKAGAGLFIGHYQYQGSRYVMPSASNRGLTASYHVADRVSLAATAQNTTSVVGFDDLLGLSQPNNITYGMSAGVELLDRLGGLKVEGYLSDASRRSDLGFNVGAITDAEKSRSMAIRVLASTPESMFSIETEVAESTFTNPNDPALSQGQGIVAVNKTTNRALFGRLVYNAYQGNTASGKPLSASLSYEFERIDPLFKTIGAFPQADLDRRQLSLTTTLGDVTLTASSEERRDNLDNLSTLLTTKTQNSQVSASFPLKSILVSRDTDNALSVLLPDVNVHYTQVHQFGDNRPDLNPLSGFSLSHIPNQWTRATDISCSWRGETWNVGYNYNQSWQDNRQLGRELADFINTLHGISAQVQLFDGLSVNAGFSRNVGVDKEQLINTYTLHRNIGLNWGLGDGWTLSGNVDLNRISDSQQQSNSRSLSANAQIAWQYDLKGFGSSKIPLQAYVRYDRQINETADNVFGFNSNATDWKILAGISLSVF